LSNFNVKFVRQKSKQHDFIKMERTSWLRRIPDE